MRDERNDDVYDTDDVEELRAKLSSCFPYAEDLACVPQSTRVRWWLDAEERAALLRLRIKNLGG